jgi:hypothetical protein
VDSLGDLRPEKSKGDTTISTIKNPVDLQRFAAASEA